MYHIYSANLSLYGFLWEKFTLPRWVGWIWLFIDKRIILCQPKLKKKFSSFFRFMVRNWCFLSKSDVNVITGGKHIPVSSPVSRLLLLWLWTGYNTLYTWLHFADPKQKEVCCTTLQCSNQGANHGTLPLHWPWPNGKCCGKAEITGEYSINKWQIKQWLASNNGLKCLWAPQTPMIFLFCTWSI